MSRFTDHLTRFRHQAGARVQLGARSYRVRGYISNILTLDEQNKPHLIPPLGRALEQTHGAFVDVGVNLGQTLSKVLRLDPEREYVGFEPQIAACHYVTLFLRDNGLNHMRVLPLGLSDSNALRTFHAAGEADGMGSLIDTERPGTFTTTIQTRIGDEVLAELGCERPGIVKIDVEGAELFVLRGLRRTLENARPILFFEMLPSFSGHERTLLPEDERRKRDNAAAAQFEFLSTLEYEVRQIDSAGDEHTIEAFVLDRPDEYMGSDYVAYPREQRQS